MPKRKEKKKDKKKQDFEMASIEYQVESIIARKIEEGESYYLVKWTGYPMSDATWEPEKNVDHLKHMLKNFAKHNPHRSKKKIKDEKNTGKEIQVLINHFEMDKVSLIESSSSEKMVKKHPQKGENDIEEENNLKTQQKLSNNLMINLSTQITQLMNQMNFVTEISNLNQRFLFFQVSQYNIIPKIPKNNYIDQCTQVEFDGITEKIIDIPQIENNEMFQAEISNSKPDSTDHQIEQENIEQQFIKNPPETEEQIQVFKEQETIQKQFLDLIFMIIRSRLGSFSKGDIVRQIKRAVFCEKDKTIKYLIEWHQQSENCF